MPKDDFEVGYGKPPQATQFKKGQSGNPKGRPKGSSNHWTRLTKAVERKLPVKEGARTTVMSRLDMAIEQWLNQAAQGNAGARRDLFAALDAIVLQQTQTADSSATDQAKKVMLASLMKRLMTTEGTEEPQPDQKTSKAREEDDLINVIP